jgi:hypothetical protein
MYVVGAKVGFAFFGLFFDNFLRGHFKIHSSKFLILSYVVSFFKSVLIFELLLGDSRRVLHL